MITMFPIGMVWFTGLILALMEVLFARFKSAAKYSGMAVLICAFGLVAFEWPGPEDFNFVQAAFSPDAFALFLQAVVLLGGLGAVLIQKNDCDADCKTLGTTGLALLSVSGAMLSSGAQDMLVLLVGFLSMVFPLWATAVISSGENGREAALKGLFATAVGASFWGLGVALLLVRVGTTGFVEIARVLSCIEWTGGDPMMVASIICLIAGIGCMIALVPFHMWLVDFVQGLSTSGSMLLFGGVIVGGMGAFARFLLVALPGSLAGEDLLDWISVLHGLSMAALLGSNAVALVQKNAKRLAAYLLVGQVGLVGLALAACGKMKASSLSPSEAMGGVLVFLAVHAVSWLGFFVAQSVIESEGEADPNVGRLEGLVYQRPWLAVSLGLALLCMAGMPPSAGFFSRLYFLKALVDVGWNTTAVVAALSFGLVLVMCLGLVATMIQKPSESIALKSTGWGLRLVAVVASIVILLFGVLPGKILELAIFSAGSLW